MNERQPRDKQPYLVKTDLPMPTYEETLALLQQHQDESVLPSGNVEPLKAREGTTLVGHTPTTLYSRIEGIY